MNRLRVLYFGVLGTLSRQPLAKLLATPVDVVAVVVPQKHVPPFLLADDGRLPIQPISPTHKQSNLLNQGLLSPLEMADQRGIPTFAVSKLDAQETIHLLDNLAADVICVSCFPWLLPPAILQLPQKGCLNVHPSLLPQFRGPAPIFWTFRKGVQHTGVTAHLMDEQFDTGDIVAQRPYTISDGATEAMVEKRLGVLGGELLVEILDVMKNKQIGRRPQPKGGATDHWPTDNDFQLMSTWSAQRAYNFVQGTGGWKRPYFVTVQGEKQVLNPSILSDEIQFKQYWEQHRILFST